MCLPLNADAGPDSLLVMLDELLGWVELRRVALGEEYFDRLLLVEGLVDFARVDGGAVQVEDDVDEVVGGVVAEFDEHLGEELVEDGCISSALVDFEMDDRVLVDGSDDLVFVCPVISDVDGVVTRDLPVVVGDVDVADPVFIDVDELVVE